MATGTESTGTVPTLCMKRMLQCGYAALVCETAFFREGEFLVSGSTSDFQRSEINDLKLETWNLKHLSEICRTQLSRLKMRSVRP